MNLKIINSIVFIYTLTFVCGSAQAQDTVRIGVTGLTCSSCSKAVEREMIKISFVKSVIMNLNTNEATVIIDDIQQVDWSKLAKSVYNAGFSVGYFNVPSCNKSDIAFGDKDCKQAYQYIGPSDRLPDADYYHLVGKYFMDKKTYSKWQAILKELPKTDLKEPIYYYY
jgi:copper chaperone CopZ